MLRVEVKSTQLTTKSGTSKKGTAYTLREQEVWVHFSDGQVIKARVTLDRDAPAYDVGAYVVADSSFGVDPYGQLGLRRLVLQRVPSEGRKVA